MTAQTPPGFGVRRLAAAFYQPSDNPPTTLTPDAPDHKTVAAELLKARPSLHFCPTLTLARQRESIIRICLS
jgi:hypothetical protein